MFWAFGSPVLVLSSMDTANDLLTKRGQLYSDRPRLVMADEARRARLARPLTR